MKRLISILIICGAYLCCSGCAAIRAWEDRAYRPSKEITKTTVPDDAIKAVEIMIADVIIEQDQFIKEKDVKYIFLNITEDQLSAFKSIYTSDNSNRLIELLTTTTMKFRQLKYNALPRNRVDKKPGIFVDLYTIEFNSETSLEIRVPVTPASQHTMTWEYRFARASAETNGPSKESGLSPTFDLSNASPSGYRVLAYRAGGFRFRLRRMRSAGGP